MSIKANYGHAGIEFISWLMQHRSDWVRIEDEYRTAVRHYCAQAPAGADDAVVHR